VLSVDEAYRQIAHNIHLFIYVKLVDETWKGGTRRRYVSEIRQVTRAIEHGRPVTHLTYHATGAGSQSAGISPMPTSRPSCSGSAVIFHVRLDAGPRPGDIRERYFGDHGGLVDHRRVTWNCVRMPAADSSSIEPTQRVGRRTVGPRHSTSGRSARTAA
jgi:hypothetical protein